MRQGLMNMRVRWQLTVLLGMTVVVSSCATVEPEAEKVSPGTTTISTPVTVVKPEPAAEVEVLPAAPQPSVTMTEEQPEAVTAGTEPASGSGMADESTMVAEEAAPVTAAATPAEPEAVTGPSAAAPEKMADNIPPNTFIVTAAPKDPSHLYYGIGHTIGLVVNGEQGKELVVTRGETYTFKIDTGVQHDFYLSTSPRGWGASTLTEGVKGNFTYKGIVTFKPTDDTPDVVYYQCRNHKNMGSKIHVVNKGEEGKVVFGARDDVTKGASTARQSAFTTGNQAEQKVKFAEMFIAMSPAAKRIEASDHAGAKQMLVGARQKLADAKAALAANQPEQAITTVDEALRLMSAASQMVPTEDQLAEMKARYDELLHAAQTYEKSYRRNYKAMIKKGGKDLPDLDIDALSKDIADAEALAADSQYFEANKKLSMVQRTITGALTKLLADETMDYTLTFDTPKEKYEYEVARYKSFEELIPIAIEQKKPPTQTRALMDQFVDKAKSIYELSGPKAAEGDYETAIQMLEGATSNLQRALRVVGVR